MTDREVMQQALDALEAKGDAWIVLERKAIISLRAALAETTPEPYDYRFRYDRPCYKCKSAHCPANCKDTAPQQQAEPVQRKSLTDEKVNECGMCGYVGKDKDKTGQCPKCRWDELRPLTGKAHQKPLTDDQIYEMYNEPRSDAEMLEFARAIEAAHGIKEQP